MACTKDSVYAWFDSFETFCRENGINSADQIYNCDESGFPFQTGTSMKVCCDRQIRRNFQIASNSKTSITTLQCICANGTVVPPAVIFPGVKFNPEYGIGFPGNFYLGFTKNGWMETPQFYGWVTNHFIKRIPAIRQIVLLIDGHGSHIDFHTSQFCLQNQVLLYRFPPHTSHALQLTDRGYFGVFKSNFSKAVAQFAVENPGVTIMKRQFPLIFTKTYDQSCRADVVKLSFRTTGIWPTNHAAVDHGLFKPAESYVEPVVDFQIDQQPIENTINLTPALSFTEITASMNHVSLSICATNNASVVPESLESAECGNDLPKIPDINTSVYTKHGRLYI